MPVQDASLILKGRLFLRNRSTTEGGIEVGNVSGFAVAHAETEISQTDFTQPGGSKRNSVRRVDAVTISVTATDFTAANLRRYLRGVSAAVAGGAVSDESISAPATLDENSFVKTAKPIDTTASVTVTSDPAGTTYTEGTDYEIVNFGIVILAAGAISASDPLLVTYTGVATNKVQSVTGSQPEFEVSLAGVNEAQNSQPVLFNGYRCKFSLPTGLDLIADDFASLEVEGELLADSAITATDESQFYTLDVTA